MRTSSPRSRDLLLALVSALSLIASEPLVRAQTFTQDSGSVTESSELDVPYESRGETYDGYHLGGTASLSLKAADLVLRKQAGKAGTFDFNIDSGDAATLSFSGSSQL